MDPVLELLDQVLLVAAFVGLVHNHRPRGGPVVGDIEEVADFVEQSLLALRHRQVLAQHHDPIGLATLGRAILELGHLLGLQAHVLVPTLSNDSLFDVLGTLTWFGANFILGRPVQGLPKALRQAVGEGDQIGHGVDPEDKTHLGSVVPAIQVLRLAEVRVAPQPNLPKAGGPTQVDRPVEIRGRGLTARAVAATIDQIQRLARVGQGNQQRMITPNPLVRDIHPFLALARRLGNGPIGLDEGLAKEGLGLLFPDVLPHPIDDLHQGQHVFDRETPAEIPGRRGVGNPLRPQGVQIHLIVPQPFEVLQAVPVAQDVVGDIQHVIRLVVRQMALEQVQLLIERGNQPRPLGHQVQGPEAAIGKAPGSLGHLIMNIAGAEHRVLLGLPHAGRSLRSILCWRRRSLRGKIPFTRNASWRLSWAFLNILVQPSYTPGFKAFRAFL